MTGQQKQTVDEFKFRLSSDSQWATRAVVVLYERQTPQERQGMHTEELNGRGFTKFDAELLSSFAQQVGRGRPLSEKQLAICFKRLPKYAGQLYQASVERGKAA